MAKPSPADGRRSSRISLSLPIVIHGKDAQQNAFREDTHTLIVNKHGTKFVTSHRLAVGAEILIENPTLGSIAKANIVWVSTKTNRSGMIEAGAQLMEAQNIWGIEFPPDDWVGGEEKGAPQRKSPPPRAKRISRPRRPPRRRAPPRPPRPQWRAGLRRAPRSLRFASPPTW